MLNCLDDMLKLVKDHGEVKKGEEPIYDFIVRDDFLSVLA